jgi:hypothetical protein
VSLATYTDPAELYLARGEEVNPNRPLFTGDVILDIPIPGVQDAGPAMVVAHPCSIRGPAGRLLETTLVAAVRERDKFRQSVIRPALRAAGLPDTLRTYDLRHSHASLLIDRGANVLAVAQRMGHSDPTVTLRVYGHLFDGVQEKLTEELDQLRRDTEGPVDAPVVSLDDRRRGA